MIAKIIDLQNPESKGKLKQEAASPGQVDDDHHSAGLHPPKRLKFQDARSETIPTSNITNNSDSIQSSSDAMEKEISKLSEKRNNLQQEGGFKCVKVQTYRDSLFPHP